MKNIASNKLKWFFIIAIFSIASFFLVAFLNFKFLNKELKYTVLETVRITNASNEMTDLEASEYFSEFWEDTYESNIKPSNEKFYNRFNRAYYWWGIRASDSEDDYAVLEASKPHLLAALFLDYSPDNFNGDISKWAASGDLDNVYLSDENFAYQVCDGKSDDDANCGANNTVDEDYKPENVFQALIQLIADAYEGAQKYLDDKDSIRALGRHLFVYQPVCHVTRTLSDGSFETFDYTYESKYSFDELLDLFAQFNIFESIYSAFPEYQDCRGADSHWLKANGGDASYTTFGLSDVVDLCSFYKHLVESDYFENHVHFKSDFAEINKYTSSNQEYLIESSKLKVSLAREIIDIVDLSNNDDPVYDSSVTAAGGMYGDYSLSEDLYITLSNNRTDSSGYEIKNGSFPIDQYVEGVLDAEVLGAFFGTNESETSIYTALQANAIAIRTYALKVTNEGTKSISNSTANQVFTDKFLENEGSKYLAARNAALSTTGQVLTENGSLIMSEYSSFSKKTGYYCEGDLCYTTYLKIGAKNSGTSHTVVARKSWGLAGGHNRGMSQWGSLYLAANGYTYQQILANFYAENVVVANYDYSYKSTEDVEIGEYGGKEAMLVCQLFTSSDYANIRDLLEGYTTLEIPLRLTSTKYQSSHGYNQNADNGISYDRYDTVHGQVYQCEWNSKTTALLYACYDNLHGYIINEENYKKDDGGNYLDINGKTTTDPSKRVLLDVSETGTDVYLPNAIVWQYAINMLNVPLPTEGGWSAHGYYEAVAGFYPSYVFGNLPTNMTAAAALNTDGTVKTEVTKGDEIPCDVGYVEKSGQCCSIKGEEQCYEMKYETIEKIVYDEDEERSKLNNTTNSLRYDAMLVNNYEEMDPSSVFYTGLTDEAAIALSTGNGSSFYNASHVDTYLYMYVDDYTKLDPSLQTYFAETVSNIVQSAGLDYGSTLRKANIYTVEAKGTTSTSGFVNVTAYLESLGFVNIGGVADKSYSSIESHHWQLACDYYSTTDPSEVWLRTLSNNYCCKGLMDSNTKYDNYEDGNSYLETSSALGGYFSEAWEIEFCTNTLVGKQLVKSACETAFKTQKLCLSQCYKTDEDGEILFFQDEPIIDYTKKAKNCKYDITEYGGTGVIISKATGTEIYEYIKNGSSIGFSVNLLTGEKTKKINTLRNIGAEGECSCAILEKGIDNGTTE